ncbi:ragulator complex protein LAMTOR4 isoform X1 [Austrofundulus limnaeus]|uniref:Ragulator complex protein LAMTOR4 n=1 Tax=Austrofundulus limnaeus TaxID=52670 RepID=A0A2I4D9Y0_AUSLI|nr:PREDICTED: ragulator complex protein LAMTOR4 isoform X1 [Austrofundulus limnaeus]
MTTAALTAGLDRIPDQLGYLVISEDGVLAVSLHRAEPDRPSPVQSAGELENDEHTAGVIMQMVRTACRFRLSGSAEAPFKRMSVILDDFVYVATISGQKVFVVKRQNNQHQAVCA